MPEESKEILTKFGFHHAGGHWWKCGVESVIIGVGSYTYYKNRIADGILFTNIEELRAFLQKR